MCFSFVCIWKRLEDSLGKLSAYPSEKMKLCASSALSATKGVYIGNSGAWRCAFSDSPSSRHLQIFGLRSSAAGIGVSLFYVMSRFVCSKSNISIFTSAQLNSIQKRNHSNKSHLCFHHKKRNIWIWIHLTNTCYPNVNTYDLEGFLNWNITFISTESFWIMIYFM